MNRMRIIAPARSPFMAKQVISAGADEIYVGLRPIGPKQLSFDGRFQTVGGHSAHVEDGRSLEKIVNEAHRHGVPVQYCANPYLLPRALEHQYLHHVERGLSAGVDSVHVSSLQTLKLMRKHFDHATKVTMGSQFGTVNEGHMRLLADHGVSAVVVSNALTLDELSELSKYGVALVVRGNLESGGVPGYCRMIESPNSDQVGEGSRTRYEVRSDRRTSLAPYLDDAHDCNLCSLNDLLAAGVGAIKLLGREAPNPVTMAAVVALFREWLELYGRQRAPHEIRRHMEQQSLLWTMRWKPRFCDQQRCCHGYNVDHNVSANNPRGARCGKN